MTSGPRRGSPRTTGVVAVVVTYNNAGHIAELVESLQANGSSYPPRILVVDNASQDDSVAVAARLPGVTVLETGANLGYSGAINVARRHVSPGEALAILNPDLVLAPGSIENLLRALDDPAVGIAVPLLREPDGEVYPHLRTETSIMGSLGDAIFGAHWAGRPRWASDSLRRPIDYLSARDVAWAGGAALLVAPDCNARLGDWNNEKYFLYSEETDYARRARDAGYRVRFVPTAEATHVGGGSGQSAQLLALMAVNRVRYFRSHHGRVASGAFRVVVALHHALRSKDVRHRFAAATVCSRAAWNLLPPAQPPTQTRAVRT